VTHGLAAAANRGWLTLREWEASYRAAQLEAEIAQVNDALARRDQIGVATELLAQDFALTAAGPARGHCTFLPHTEAGGVRPRDVLFGSHPSRPLLAEIVRLDRAHHAGSPATARSPNTSRSRPGRTKT
jgi:hypothetical protein